MTEENEEAFQRRRYRGEGRGTNVKHGRRVGDGAPCSEVEGGAAS